MNCAPGRTVSLISVAAAFLLVSACGPPVGGRSDADRRLANPRADGDRDTEPFHLSDGGWEFTVTPLARYVLRGVVVSRENYGWGWSGGLAPCDVAMAWGELAEGGAWRKLDWSQDGRWFFWRWTGAQPFPTATVVRSASNTHVVPANPNLKRAARSLGKGDVAELSGELIRIEGRRGGELVTWRSSLSREDTGDGSCELLYLRRLRVNGKVYE